MDMPPSRYKVVEQGRRLVVLDSWNGDAPVTGHAPRSDATPPPATVEQARAALHARPRTADRAGNAPAGASETIITTQSWFDAKGPRRIRIDASGQGQLLIVAMVAAMAVILLFVLTGWPLLLVAGFALAQPRVRAGLRQGVTAWLDMQQAG
jgi:hypothetical protein